MPWWAGSLGRQEIRAAQPSLQLAIEAALHFLAAIPYGRVIIGHVEERAEKLLQGSAGTTITAG